MNESNDTSLASVFTYASTAQILSHIPNFSLDDFLKDGDSYKKLFPGLEAYNIRNFFDVIDVEKV